MHTFSEGGAFVQLVACGSGPSAQEKAVIREALSKSASGCVLQLARRLARLMRCSYWAMVNAVDAFLQVGSDMVAPFASIVEKTRPSSVVVDVAT